MADTDNENYEEQGAVGGQHLDDTDRLSIDRDLAEFNLQPQNNSSETPMRALTVAHSSPNNHDSPYDSAPGTVQRLRSSGGENAEAVQQIDSMVSRLRPDSGLAPNILLARGVDGLSQQDPNVDVLMSQLSDIDINTLMSALTKKLKSASKPQRDLQQIKVLLDAETPRVLFTWPRGFEYTGLNRDEFTVTPYQPSVLDGYVILQLTINVPESYHLIRERDQSRIKNSMCSMLKDYLPDGVLPRISPPLSPKLADRCELQINETRIEVEIHLLPQEQQALKDKYIKTSYEPPHFDENDHAVEVVLPLILKKCSRDPCPYCPQNTTDTPDERDENSDQDREGNRWSGNPVQPEDSFSTNASDCSSQPENNVQIVEQLDENRDSLALKSSPNFWKAGSRTLTLNVPQEYHLIRETDQIVKGSVCSMLKDYLPGVFSPKSTRPLSDRCEMLPSNGVTQIKLAFHLLPQELQAWDIYALRKDPEPAIFDYTESGAKVDIHTCVYVTAENLGGTDGWIGWMVPDILNSQAEHYQRHLMVEVEVDVDLHHAAQQKSPEHLQVILNSVEYQADRYQLLLMEDKYGRTPVHLAAQRKSSEHLRVIFNSVDSQENRYKLLLIKNKVGETPLHHAAQQESPEHMQVILNSLECQEKRLKLLQIKKIDTIFHIGFRNDHEATPVHLAAQRKSSEHLRVIFNSVDSQADRYQLLLMEHKYGRTPLHHAAQQISPEHLQVILNSVDSQENRYKLLLIKNKVGETPLHHAAQQESPEHLQVILNSVDSQADRYKLLLMEGEYGRTALHHAARRESPEHLQVILNSLECQEKRLKLLQIKKIDTIFHIGFLNDHEATPVHLAAQRKSSEHLRVIFNSVDSQADRYQLLLMEDKYGRTPLHHAAQQISPEHLQVIFNSVDSQADRYKLPLMKNDFGETPLHHAAQQESREHMKVLLIPLLCQKKCLKLLQNKKIDTILHIEFLNDHEATPVHLAAQRKSPIHLQVILTLEDSQADRYQLLQMEDKNKRTALHHAEKQSLSTRDCSCDLSAYPAEELNFIGVGNQSHYRRSFARNIKGKVIICQSPHVEKRPICQDRASPSGFILYNCANRRGAQDEAQNFEHKLQQIGYGVITIGWSHTDELVKLLSCKSNTAQHTIAPLILSIMTHGHKGILSGTNNSEISINSLLHQLEKSLPPTKPLVLIIQACQAALLDTAELDRTKPKHAQDQSIELSRPNTVLMLATVEGGLAYRGAFTGAIADEISKADGVTSIDTMFSRAVVKTRQIDPHQIPEIRSTMKEPLVLPSGPKPQS